MSVLGLLFIHFAFAVFPSFSRCSLSLVVSLGVLFHRFKANIF